MNSLEIGKRIKERRQLLDLTQEQLGKPLGLNKSTIQRYEAGHVEKIKLPVMQELARILKTTPAYLMCWEDDPKEKGQPENELPLTESESLLLELSADLPKEDMNKLIDYAQLLKKANNQ